MKEVRIIKGKPVEVTVRNLDKEPMTPEELRLAAKVGQKAVGGGDTSNARIDGTAAREAALREHRREINSFYEDY